MLAEYKESADPAKIGPAVCTVLCIIIRRHKAPTLSRSGAIRIEQHGQKKSLSCPQDFEEVRHKDRHCHRCLDRIFQLGNDDVQVEAALAAAEGPLYFDSIYVVLILNPAFLQCEILICGLASEPWSGHPDPMLLAVAAEWLQNPQKQENKDIAE